MFTVSSKGSGKTYVFGLNTQKARVVSMGATTVLLNGNVSDGGSLEVDGTSKVYLTGAIGGTLAVNLDYQSTTYVQGTSGENIHFPDNYTPSEMSVVRLEGSSPEPSGALECMKLRWWPEQLKLPAKGKEYPEMGYKRLRDWPPKAPQQQPAAQ
ncbi:hypothetical protein QJQ45_025706 [Haematococcus lacustris]|nr:hypothetical protein QJQ45_025706 [Haematococcus lacustris]